MRGACLNAEFVKSAILPKDYPQHNLPEIAFLGRSNVGKSSVINALLNRKSLVKTGKTPGKTRLINFFDIEKTFFFVDLPGYGYAKVSKKEKESWSKNIYTYLSQREQLKLCVLILDIRRIPSNDDISVINMLYELNKDTLFLLNKSDKLSNNEIYKQVKIICDAVGVSKENIVIFSALKKRGIDETWTKIKEILF
ncbi:MAG: GTP-binding protein [Deferribacteres bacterium]|nr:YihA family ribosome biosis GTP-binding protein [Deferribacteraceae bacterium]MDK2792094.1 GTP-binding protein [Deferribacteres bacterium]